MTANKSKEMSGKNQPQVKKENMKPAHPIGKGLEKDVNTVPDSGLTREDFLRFTDELMAGGEAKTEFAGLEELQENLKQDQEKINLLVRYINDLLGVIHRLEEQLQQTSDTGIVGRTMVAGLAHDLRNPMSVISSCAQFCLENEKLTPLTKEYLQMIQDNSRAANKMLTQFIEFAKANLTFKSVNLNQIVTKMWELATLDSLDAGDPKITFGTHLAENLPEIFGDPEKIERIFLNLFLNAIQAVSQNCSKGMVTVRTRFLRAQNLVEVDVIDNGPGIPEEIQNKIFEPFFTTKKEGTGLGLHLCQAFVEQHKGEIIIGKPPKAGTKVTVRLPVTQEGGIKSY